MQTAVKFGYPEIRMPVESIFIPLVGQRVFVMGSDDVRVVIYVDRAQGTADLMKLGVARNVEGEVPLSLLSAAPYVQLGFHDSGKRRPAGRSLRDAS
jgi:hypothetical protein